MRLVHDDDIEENPRRRVVPMHEILGADYDGPRGHAGGDLAYPEFVLVFVRKKVGTDAEQRVLPQPEPHLHDLFPVVEYRLGHDEQQRTHLAAHREFAEHHARLVGLAATHHIREHTEPSEVAEQPARRILLMSEDDIAAPVQGAADYAVLAAPVLVVGRRYPERSEIVVAVERVRELVAVGDMPVVPADDIGDVADLPHDVEFAAQFQPVIFAGLFHDPPPPMPVSNVSSPSNATTMSAS